MKISELATRAGISTTAVRFYEKQGILPASRRRDNRYRDFTDIDLCRLRMVVALRKLGLDLPECGRLASLCCAGQCDEMADELATRVEQRRQEVAMARRELDHLDAELANLQLALKAGESPASLCTEGRNEDARVPLPLRP